VVSEPTTIRDRKRSPWYLGPLVTLLAVLAVLGYRHLRSSPMDGTWVRESSWGRLEMPDATARVPEISHWVNIRLTREKFIMRFWAFESPQGAEHFTVQLDGLEHPYLSLLGSPIKTTYRAHTEGDSVVVNKHVFSPSQDFGSYAERWSMTPDGHRLTVSAGDSETTYKRAPFLRSLFRASP
jgi:hypothetical protein